MLESLAQEIGRKRLIVTFNGRSFDLPRLEARFALCGLPSPFTDRVHVDLLDAARRLNARSRESRGLRALESRVLGVDRADVIARHPSLYFRGHRTERPASWDPLFLHNALDVLSLVTLVAHIGRVMSRPSPAASLLLALARWDDETGSPASAAKLYARAWRLDPGGDVGEEAIAGLARLSRRRGKKAAVDYLWQSEVATTQSDSRKAVGLVELGKCKERNRDYQAAVSLFQEAAVLLSSMPRYRRPLHPTAAEVEGRCARIKQRWL